MSDLESFSILGGTTANKAWNPPKLPETLTTDAVRPVLSSSDPDTAGGAAYLLVLLGEPGALTNLVEAWRQNKASGELWQALAQAVAAAGDDNNADFVREVYESFDSDDKQRYGGDLYWTIRGMSGPKAAQWRKELRAELGRKIFD